MFNRRQIMKTAWHYRRRFGHSMQQAMIRAWREAKMAMMRYNVIGQRFNREDETIASGVTYERACELEWFNKYRFDNVVVRAA